MVEVMQTGTGCRLASSMSDGLYIVGAYIRVTAKSVMLDSDNNDDYLNKS